MKLFTTHPVQIKQKLYFYAQRRPLHENFSIFPIFCIMQPNLETVCFSKCPDSLRVHLGNFLVTPGGPWWLLGWSRINLGNSFWEEGKGAKHSPPGLTKCIHYDFIMKVMIFFYDFLEFLGIIRDASGVVPGDPWWSLMTPKVFWEWSGVIPGKSIFWPHFWAQMWRSFNR